MATHRRLPGPSRRSASFAHIYIPSVLSLLYGGSTVYTVEIHPRAAFLNGQGLSPLSSRFTVYLISLHIEPYTLLEYIPPGPHTSYSSYGLTAYCRVARTAAAAPASAPARSHCRRHRSHRAGRRAASPSRPALLAWRRPARSRRAPWQSWRWPRPPRSRVRTPRFTQEGNRRPWGYGEGAPIGPRNSAP